jgi:hypothetical protein
MRITEAYRLVNTQGNWETGDVNYSDPPSISFTVEPPVGLEDQFRSQMGLDEFLQSDKLPERLGERGRLVAGGLTEGYIIRFANRKDSSPASTVIECVFPGVRRGHLASSGASQMLGDVITTLLNEDGRGE